MAMVAEVLVAALSLAGEGCRRDETGIEWVLPYEQAAEQAKRLGRLLLIKPIAFGTAKDGGW
jgi:hypothetical protein